MGSFVANGGRLDEIGHTRLLDELFTEGYSARTTTGWKVTDAGAADMTVDIGEGAGFIEASDIFHYPAWTDDDTNIAITAADATNPRIDRVVAYIDLADIDTGVTNNPDALKFVAVAGTPAGTPAAPSDGTVQTAVGGSNPWLELARVAVAAGATTITDANITDTRQRISLRNPSPRYLAHTATNYGDAGTAKSALAEETTLATNFTMPASGRVKVILNLGSIGNPGTNGASTDIRLGVGSTFAGMTTIATAIVGGFGSTAVGRVPADLVGIFEGTPGTSYTARWGFGTSSGTARVYRSGLMLVEDLT